MEKEKGIRSGSRRYYWMRLKTDFFDKPEIKKLRKLAGGDTYTIIYLKMMLKTLSNNGLFIYKGIEDTFEKEVALIIDEDENNVLMTISYLRTHNLLEEGYSENAYLLNAVPELIGSETADAERKRIARSMGSSPEDLIERGDIADNVRQLSEDVRNCPTEIEQNREEQEIEIDKEHSTVHYAEQNRIFNSSEELEDYVCKNLNDEQYDAFKQLFSMMIKGELKTSKQNLYRYFQQLMSRDWKDSNGKPIRDIVRYVESNFAMNYKPIKTNERMN
ncbi:MAG: phage replisome organizer N-terminal domain-containing protein [Erysipelotrichaceae bacterium]|nr:phage replisome organizer N-terminal domain-containing protein [Erysipelotrichaceae bacterium]